MRNIERIKDLPLGTKSVAEDGVGETGDLSLSLLGDLEGKDTNLVAAGAVSGCSIPHPPSDPTQNTPDDAA